MSNLDNKDSVAGSKISVVNIDPENNTIEFVLNESAPQTEIEKIKNLSIRSHTYNITVKVVEKSKP